MNTPKTDFTTYNNSRVRTTTLLAPFHVRSFICFLLAPVPAAVAPPREREREREPKEEVKKEVKRVELAEPKERATIGSRESTGMKQCYYFRHNSCLVK